MRLFLFFLLISFRGNAADLSQVDNYEVQLALCEKNIHQITDLLPKKQLDPSANQLSFFDTSDFIFFTNSISFKKRSSDSLSQIDLKKNYPLDFEKKFDCEIDYYSSNQKIGCKLKNKYNSLEFQLSNEQVDYITSQKLDPYLKNLVEFGPFPYEKWTFDKYELDQISTAEKNYIELSTKIKSDSPQNDPVIVLNEMIAWANKNKIKICPTQMGRWEQIRSKLDL